MITGDQKDRPRRTVSEEPPSVVLGEIITPRAEGSDRNRSAYAPEFDSIDLRARAMQYCCGWPSFTGGGQFLVGFTVAGH